ncbi:SymE family type I addiction module toxin [Dryocola sp. BD586]|uniref:SymE family type I addiction module toxin n=1 Tax=Dryocola sp. BD586 TaxID=3133271 RepID=UPI003F50824D
MRDWETHKKATAITLKGGWLADAGFETGTPLKVHVMPGCLVLTAQEPVVIPPLPPEPEVMLTLRKVCKLPLHRQRQGTDFIEMVMAKKPPLSGS